MSTAVTDLKQERSDLRKKITLASKRVHGAIERNRTEDIIHKFALELEAVYSDFLSIQDDYVELVNSNPDYAEHEIVNGLTCQQYSEAVTDVYETAMSKHDEYFQTLKDEAKEIKAKPLLVEISYLSTCVISLGIL